MPPLLYRVFSASLIVFFACIVFFAGISPLHAQTDDVYQAKGVMVDVSAASALEARKQAFADARRKAYEQMATQALAPQDRARLIVPDDKVIANLVRDFEIVSEKMTSKRYAGIIDVRFVPAAVKRSFQFGDVATSPPPATDPLSTTTTTTTTTVITPADATLPDKVSTPVGEEDYIYSPTKKAAVRVAEPASTYAPTHRVVSASSRNILVLPWYGAVSRQTLWDQENPWRAAWEADAKLATDKIAPIMLPVGDADDVRDYSPPQPLSARVNVQSLMTRYQASEVALALAEPMADGSVNVALYRYEGNGLVPVDRFAISADSHDVLADAVAKSADALRMMPAQAPVMYQPAPAQADVSEPGSAYRTLVKYSGLQEWMSVRDRLSRIPGVSGIGVRAISPSQATIDFGYAGDYTGLASALAQSGLQMTQLPPGSADGNIQYLLTAGM
jgi:hypothetical protein